MVETDEVLAEAPDAQALRRLLQRRRSCRGFLKRQVPEATIRAILELAQLSPSGCNTQPWHATVFSGVATDRFRIALTEVARTQEPTPDLPFPREYAGIYRQRRREAAWALYDSLGVVQGDRAASAEQMLRNFGFFEAPHVAIITTEEALGAYGVVDTGIYIGAFLLAACGLGLAAVPQGAIAEHSAFIRDYLGLPPGRLVVAGISFGFEDIDHPANAFRTRRAALLDSAIIVAE